MVTEIEAVIERSLRVRPQMRADLIARLSRQYPRVLRDAIERSLWRLIRLGKVADEEGRLRAAPRPILRLRCWYG